MPYLFFFHKPTQLFSVCFVITRTNQHKSFQHVLSSLVCFPRNFLEDHSSQNCFKSNTFNCGVLMEWAI